MRISERCSCGATFDADDGATTFLLLYELSAANVGKPQYQQTEVEAQAIRWRSGHRHVASAETDVETGND